MNLPFSMLCFVFIMIAGLINLSIPIDNIEDPVLSDYYSGVEAMKNQGDYNKALTSFLNFIRATDGRSEKYADLLMRTYCYVGIIYASYDDYALSMDYNLKGLEIADSKKNKRFRNAFLNNIAGICISRNQYDEARRYAKRIIEDGPVDVHQRFCYNMLMGDIALANKDFIQSNLYYQTCDTIVANTSELTDYERAHVMRALAKTYALTEHPDSQLYYLQRSYLMALRQNHPDIKLECIRQLMRYYTINGNADSALIYQDMYFAFADSLMSRTDFMEIRGDHELRGIETREQKINGLHYRLTIQWVIIGLITVVLAIVTTLLVIIFRQKRNLDIAYRVLFDRDRQIDKLQPDVSTPPAQNEIGETHPSTDEQDLFKKICSEMEVSQAYLDPDFGLPSLTAMVKSNTITVSKVISACSGQNVRAFINDYRIREARRRIMDLNSYGHMTLQAIGESVGYSTQVNFNRTFKKITGMTPSAYLNLAKENAAKNSFNKSNM